MREEKDLSSLVTTSLIINEQDLDKELATCSSYYYMFAAQATDAELIYQKVELTLEMYEVDASKKIKEDLLKDGYKKEKITETEIKRQFRKDTKWLELKHEELEAQANFKKLEKAAKSFDMKSQNCMSLNKRQLYKASKGMIGVDDL